MEPIGKKNKPARGTYTPRLMSRSTASPVTAAVLGASGEDVELFSLTPAHAHALSSLSEQQPLVLPKDPSSSSLEDPTGGPTTGPGFHKYQPVPGISSAIEADDEPDDPLRHDLWLHPPAPGPAPDVFDSESEEEKDLNNLDGANPGDVVLNVSRPPSGSPAPLTKGGPVSESRARLYASSETPKMSKQQLYSIIDFLLALASALHKYGLPTGQIEYQIAWAAGRFGVDAMVAVFPTYISASFRPRQSHKSYTYNVAIEKNWDIEKLELAYVLSRKVAKHRVTLDEGIEELQAIQDMKPRYNAYVRLACITLTSGVISSLFFAGGVLEFAVSLFCGLIVGLLVLLCEHMPGFARVLEPIGSVICSFVACLLHDQGWIGPLNTRCIMMAGIVWCLPGIHINTAIADLAAHMMVSGTARLMFALLIIFEIGFGFALGSRLASLIPGNPGYIPASASLTSSSVADYVTSLIPTMPISPWLAVLWTPAAALMLAILLGAAPKQYPVIITSASLATLVSLLSRVFNSELSTMLAMTAVVLTGNVYERSFDKPAYVATCVGAIMLIPSSVGVRGVATAILSQDIVSALTFTFTLLVTAVSMVVGGFLANMLLFPKRSFSY